MKNTAIMATAFAAMTAGASAGDVFLSEASLIAEMSAGYTHNDFNAVADGPADSLSYSIGDFAYEITTGPIPSSGLYNEGGVISTESNLDSLVINFTSGNVYAIGANVWATNPGFDPAGALMIVTLSDGTIESFPSGGPSAFYGYTSDMLISSIEIRAVGFFSQRYATLDNLYVGGNNNLTVVPLPTAAWAGLGLLGMMGGVRIARRR